MPLPDAYAACRVAEPTVSPTCGVPVTFTARLNATSTSIRSVGPYVLSPAPGLLVIDTPLTIGAVSVVLLTLWPGLFSIGMAPPPPQGNALSALIVVPAALIVAPPGNSRPLPTIVMPSESLCPACTT